MLLRVVGFRNVGGGGCVSEGGSFVGLFFGAAEGADLSHFLRLICVLQKRIGGIDD